MRRWPLSTSPENALVKKTPFRLTPYQVQWLLVVGFLTVGYALYLRYLAIEFSTVALACDAGLQTMLCKTRILVTSLFRNSVFGIVALIVATLHVIRPSIVLLTGGTLASKSALLCQIFCDAPKFALTTSSFGLGVKTVGILTTCASRSVMAAVTAA